MRQIRTDLAMESANERGRGGFPGVTISTWAQDDVNVTEVVIASGEGASLLNKAQGTYITLECAPSISRDAQGRMNISNILGEELKRLMPASDGQCVLIIGLGNRMVTPDSLGPQTIGKLLVTRHLFSALPNAVDARMCPVCAVAPGVLGVTGVETLEMARGIVGQVNPRFVIAIDALAARSVTRVGAAIQLTDTGIQPGSGVGNHQSALTQETLGVKVLALGVPTVIYAANIVRDALALLSGDQDVADEDMDGMCDAVLRSDIGDMIVTPREIDGMINDIAQLLASGINQALHPGLSEKEILAMMG